MKLGHALCAALLACWGATALPANADETFQVRLAPAPRDAAMKQAIAGHGAAQVTLRGSRLTIAGSFAGFPSPATHAALHLGPAVALRGPAIRDLAVSAATSGTLAGEVALSDAELAALGAGQFYIQIATELAPDGNVWGWLLPAAAPVIRDP